MICVNILINERGIDEGAVCHRLKLLQDKFVRELKKTKSKSGDPDPQIVSSWPL